MKITNVLIDKLDKSRRQKDLEKLSLKAKEMMKPDDYDKYSEKEMEEADNENLVLLDIVAGTDADSATVKNNFRKDIEEVISRSRKKLLDDIEAEYGKDIEIDKVADIVEKCRDTISKSSFNPILLFEEKKDDIKEWLEKVYARVIVDNSSRNSDCALSLASHVVGDQSLCAPIICSLYIKSVFKVMESGKFWDLVEGRALSIDSETIADICSMMLLDMRCRSLAEVVGSICKTSLRMPADHVTCIDNLRIISAALYWQVENPSIRLTMSDFKDISQKMTGRKMSDKEINKLAKYHNSLISEFPDSISMSDNIAIGSFIEDAVRSDFFQKFADTARKAADSEMIPLDIEPSLLSDFTKSELWESHDHPALKKIQEDFPLKAYSWMSSYVVFWACMYNRLMKIWYGTYRDKVREYLEKNHPSYSSVSDTPMLLLSGLVFDWEEKYRETEKIAKDMIQKAVKMSEELDRLKRIKEEEMAKEKENRRKEAYMKEGFTFVSESGKIEKWAKGDTCRIFFKTTDRDEMRNILTDMDELGLTSSKVRSVRNPGGVTRRFLLGGMEIYSDTVIMNVVKKAARCKPVARPDDMKMEEYLLDLAFDKVFFSLDWLDEAIVRASQGHLNIKDVRYFSSIVRNKGVIGQVKVKSSGPKTFSLTPEGYALYFLKKEHPEIPVLALHWEDYIGEYLAGMVGPDMLIDIETVPVRGIQNMVAGKAPKFMDKYYVSLI